ncbi:hypothetical protein M2475_001654 [Breznakia sp. PF5-3]|nr:MULTISPECIES: hypothetical protein [unclassified Breznakia]MDF9825732.1 hypothetical protein [Breznakia sp. PM6-1]MDF9836078.1 hypothetical protein [Breznakia sp. PF5-3]MDF9838297.1 hypothetical protein [Breznakia sp. PFB2-8]MDF9860307.1 hypothetical protein [Breznakia sp. PH5-24]
METETIDLEVLVNEILNMPNNSYTKEELKTMTYLELLDVRDELYGL